LIRNLADALEKHPVTVVSGPAGTGKSAATFMALDQSNSYCPCFVFQAREFACTHIDEALEPTSANSIWRSPLIFATFFLVATAVPAAIKLNA